MGDWMDQKKNVLFLCTGNSCRSQMAEGIINATMPEKWQAFSAGVSPSGYVHPIALQVLKEINIEHQGHSKHPDVFREQKFDLVVTLCESASESCPVWLRGGRVLHFSLDDPAKVAGTDEEKMTAFRLIRDKIIQEIPQILQD